MTHRRMVLIGSASIVAILGAAAPAFSADDSTSNPTVIVTGL